MNILEKIRHYAELFPSRAAFRSENDALTYQELWDLSDRLAAWLLKNNPNPGEPIPVYGHKHPWMLVCFLGCVKAGCAYCPIDLSVPDGRVSAILHTLSSSLVLTTEELHAETESKQVLNLEILKQILTEKCSQTNEFVADTKCNFTQNSINQPGHSLSKDYIPLNKDFCTERSTSSSEKHWVSGNSTYYIIFTSGSTGTPKGVQISADCLNHYLDWSVTLANCDPETEHVFLNQAPFSFDLSVMDLYTSLACGGTLFCLKKSVQGDYAALMDALEKSHASVWVSTPSFADMCLSERKYNAELLPELKTFLFCGEALGNRTVKKLQERFPDAQIYNTYGPTESTVAVTEVLVTQELNETVSPLPVGKAKPGTTIEIWDENGTILPEGEKGEIIILGNTVSTGYYRSPALTEKAFFTCDDGTRGYHTGDKGYLIDGMLHYCGRIDLQIKLHGYRIELEDIESNLRKLSELEHAVVLPNTRGGKVSSLTAYVVEHEKPSDEKEETTRLKAKLAEFLPDYMIPKKFVFLDQMPMTNNGKADRKALGGM